MLTILPECLAIATALRVLDLSNNCQLGRVSTTSADVASPAMLAGWEAGSVLPHLPHLEHIDLRGTGVGPSAAAVWQAHAPQAQVLTDKSFSTQ